MKYVLFIIFLVSLSPSLIAQQGSITGKVMDGGEGLSHAEVSIPGTAFGAITDGQGKFLIQNVPFGQYKLKATFPEYESETKSFHLDANHAVAEINIDLAAMTLFLDRVVITGTKTFKRQTQSPVIVNVITSKTLDNVQACNLSEGLKFQPGLRVETDCQTCNYTQLRMNGLGGSYSQILINGRPIFSPLTGLYGMEQLPANMIERIEVVRGGGSALYGSSAIGGTVNVITKLPKKSGYDIGTTYQNINGAHDRMLLGNATVVNEKGNAGAAFFVNSRTRDWYDHNGDEFSELPALKNNSFGATLFFQPQPNQKLELNVSSLNEYRYGGEMIDGPAHLALQSEERTHNVLIGNLDYQYNFNGDNSSFIAYAAGQNTNRVHYTGIFPDDSLGIANHLVAPPYGTSLNTTYQGGIQLNHRVQQFAGGSNVFTVGGEYLEDDVFDQIESYNYKIDQVTRNLGVFAQSDWEVTPAINLLTGVRADKHNLVDRLVFSPRASLLYKYKQRTQFRMTWSSGFRAPQAFDTDLHIAFAGGGISRISLSPDLKEERSNSLSGSVNYDKATEHMVAGFTLEGFYTHLKNAFYQHPLGADAFGERFEKRNGSGATVQGVTAEVRVNLDGIAQLEAGATLQSSLFDEAVENISGLPTRREFMRTPNEYGYAILTLTPLPKWTTAINMVYTGPMELVHFAGAPEQDVDEYTLSPAFAELSLRTGYTFEAPNVSSGIEVYGGIKNLFNAYQDNFDSGKNRDSNFVYGPAAPRTIFLGLRIKSL